VVPRARGRRCGAARPVLPTASGYFVDARLKKSVRQFIKFCFVGASGVIVNLGVFTSVLLLWMAVSGHISSAGDLAQSVIDLAVRKDTSAVPLAAAYVANAAGFVVSVFTNYYLNRWWTFRSNGAVSRELPKFFTVSVTAYIAQLIVFSVLHNLAHVAPIPSQLVAIACVMPINFVFNKLWSFRGA
jgi:putative flippase GtrA